MVYDEALAQRVRDVLTDHARVSELRMMGGLQFLVGGRMFAGVRNDSLWVRLGEEGQAEALRRPHVESLSIGKRTTKGFVRVRSKGIKTKRQLEFWVRLGLDFASTLPPKKAARTPRNRGKE